MMPLKWEGKVHCVCVGEDRVNIYVVDAFTTWKRWRDRKTELAVYTHTYEGMVVITPDNTYLHTFCIKYGIQATTTIPT